MNYVLAGRTIGQVLGRSGGAAAVPWWLYGGVTPFAAYAPKGAASLADSYINLANPGTYDASPAITAPTFSTATGWTMLNSPLYTGANNAASIVPAVGWTILVKFLNAAANGGLFAVTGNYRWTIWPNTTSGVDFLYAGVDNYSSPAMTAGVVGFAGNKAYRDGTLAKTLSGTPTMSYLRIGRGVDAGRYFDGIISSVWIADTTLDAAQVATQSAAMP